ncbi:hypothetical protein [Luteibacter aegosomatissinici]|uniref:hypothetical protein n=1 Tax=Luteibacter aegosomatissinici TaxID=2911539 RepID=UPI001FF78B02|nr:hypothetical protein [Luteibacter aegosomatissinici]UPG92666.1 hypothetical protein L2Y97_12395 [Luteibacter aegosomatissinici]
MIKILNTQGISGPVLCCDVCDERIDDFGLGAAVFSRSNAENSLTPVFIVHKGGCHDAAERKIRAAGLRSGWEELKHHFVYLLHNGGVSPESFVESSVSADRIGRIR